jgi:hypothetical protein
MLGRTSTIPVGRDGANCGRDGEWSTCLLNVGLGWLALDSRDVVDAHAWVLNKIAK